MSIDYTELPKNKKRKNEEYNYIIRIPVGGYLDDGLPTGEGNK